MRRPTNRSTRGTSVAALLAAAVAGGAAVELWHRGVFASPDALAATATSECQLHPGAAAEPDAAKPSPAPTHAARADDHHDVTRTRADRRHVTKSDTVRSTTAAEATTSTATDPTDLSAVLSGSADALAECFDANGEREIGTFLTVDATGHVKEVRFAAQALRPHARCVQEKLSALTLPTAAGRAVFVTLRVEPR